MKAAEIYSQGRRRGRGIEALLPRNLNLFLTQEGGGKKKSAGKKVAGVDGALQRERTGAGGLEMLIRLQGFLPSPSPACLTVSEPKMS